MTPQTGLAASAGLVAYAIPAVDMTQGATKVVSLLNDFQEADVSSAALRYQVVADSNPVLLAALPLVVAPGQLFLRAVPDELGSASLTVRATDSSGQSVVATLVVNVSAGTGGSSAATIGVTPGTGAMAVSGRDTSGAEDDLDQGAGAVITPFAGAGNYSGDGGLATNATLYDPTNIAFDSSGDLFIADTANNVVREVNASTGVISTVAGDGAAGYAGDGDLATQAELNGPQGVAVDSAGDIFIADLYNSVIREVVKSSGDIITVAGNGTWGYAGNGGLATAAELRMPADVVLDSAGDLIIADSGNYVIREISADTAGRITSASTITTVAGTPRSAGYSGNGLAADAKLGWAYGIALDASGDLFVAEYGNNVIRKISAGTAGRITSASTITTVAGTPQISGYSGDSGQAMDAELNYPSAVAVDASGDLFIADTDNSVIREVTPDGTITTVAGNYGDGAGYSGDTGQATAAELNCPQGVAINAAGDLFVADNGSLIRKVAASSGTITTFAGKPAVGGNGGVATSAALLSPQGAAVDASGNVFIADGADNVVWEVNHLTGVITTIAGNGTPGFSGDEGQATMAELNDPVGVALDASADLFIADAGNNLIRKVDLSTGVITTVAGNYADGAAAAATADRPQLPT